MKVKGGIMERRKNGGFTLVELVVVMVIVGILATISVPMYRNYVQRARAQEGSALLGSVASAQKVYFAEHGTFCVEADKNDLGVDAGGNTIYRNFTITAADATTFSLRAVPEAGVDALTMVATGGSNQGTIIGPE